jgi:plasmid stabilization system protein ParE
MKLIISKKAYNEIELSQNYYNLQKNNLGNEFKNDVKHLILNILEFPNLYPTIKNDIKRCLLHKFPYSIFYAIRNDKIIILSVAHQNKKPIY